VIRSAPLPELPDEHPLRTLAYIAASPRGLDLGHRAWLAQPQMARFAPTLANLHRRAHAIHRQGGAAAPEQIQTITDIAIADLTDVATRSELKTGRILAATPSPSPPHLSANGKRVGRPRKTDTAA